MKTWILGICLFLYHCPSSALTVEKLSFLEKNEAYYVHQDLPLVTLEFFFKGGTLLDPVGKEGRSLFTISLLNEGAGPYTAKEFDKKLDELASVISFSSGEGNGLAVQVKCLEEKVEETLELLALCLFKPRFDVDAVNRVREQIQTMLKEQSVDPNTIAQKLYATMQYPDHPFSRFPTKETVDKLSVQDLKDYLKSQLGRDLLTVGCVSHLPKERLSALLTKFLEPLPKNAPKAIMDKVTSKDPGGIQVEIVDRPQTVCQFGHRGVERTDPQYYASVIMNGILGGVPFTSRLFKKVREEKGLTYGIYTALTFDEYTNQLSGTVSTDNNRFAETYSLIQSIWADLQKNGPTEDEVKLVKDYIKGSFALNYQSSMAMAAALVSIQINNLGLDYFDTHLKKIDAVTFDQVREVARQRLFPKNLTFVAVGKPKDIVSTRGKGSV